MVVSNIYFGAKLDQNNRRGMLASFDTIPTLNPEKFWWMKMSFLASDETWIVSFYSRMARLQMAIFVGLAISLYIFMDKEIEFFNLYSVTSFTLPICMSIPSSSRDTHSSAIFPSIKRNIAIAFWGGPHRSDSFKGKLSYRPDRYQGTHSPLWVYCYGRGPGGP